MFSQDRLVRKRELLVTSPKIEGPIQNDGQFAKIHQFHHVNTNIHHWQLRDLISTSEKNTLYHPKQNALYKYNTKTKEDTLYQSLPFTPTSIDARFGYVAAVGQMGWLMLKSQNNGGDGEYKECQVGRGMNNAVCLSLQNDGELRVVVCNNDHTVSILTPELTILHTWSMPSAINHCSVSPDQQKLLLVSDKGIAYIYDNCSYQQKSEFKVSDETSLSCAWNQSSDLFGISGQDGFVHIYNLEEKLFSFGSTETRRIKKAARCVQFTNGVTDLLAYSEHVSTIYIVDTRNFQHRQVIRLAAENEDRAITGLSFSVDGRLLYVTMEDQLIEIKLDVCSRRRFTSPLII